MFSAVFPLLEASPALADDVIIHMKSGPNRFQEKVVQVKVGDRLIWNNRAAVTRRRQMTTRLIRSQTLEMCL